MTTRPDEDILAAANPALRDAYERSEGRNKELEARLSKQAFKSLGLEEDDPRRQAITRFFDGDVTDADAIREFAEKTMGYDLSGKPVTEEPEPAHVDPAPSVAADAKSDELDTTAEATPVTEPDENEEYAAHMTAAVEKGHGNEDEVTAAMSAELRKHGYEPGKTIDGRPLQMTEGEVPVISE